MFRIELPCSIRLAHYREVTQVWQVIKYNRVGIVILSIGVLIYR